MKKITKSYYKKKATILKYANVCKLKPRKKKKSVFKN